MKFLCMAALVFSIVFAKQNSAAETNSKITIVSHSRPKCVILVKKNAAEEVCFAANELRDYIERISGGRLDLRHNKTDKDTAIEIGVDESLKSELTEDGFMIRINSTGVQIYGATGLASVYAVYTFLEDNIGCRWFFPSEIGEDIPHCETITVESFEKTYRPDFRYRKIQGVGAFHWNLKNRLTEELHICNNEYNKIEGGAHTFCKLLPLEKYYKQHPEWFALIDGKRQGPADLPEHDPQPCTSNPEVIHMFADQINKIFDEKPNLMMVGLGPNDRLKFCECNACQAQDEPGRPWQHDQFKHMTDGRDNILSRRLLLFYNAVAKLVYQKHPDKLLKVMFYACYQEPPSDPNLKLADNVFVMLTHYTNPEEREKVYPSCYNHSMTDLQCRPNQRFVETLKGWQERTKHLGIYDYYYKESVCEGLFPIVHAIRENLPYLHSVGAEYLFTQGDANNSGIVGLNYYVTAKLAWDVNTDVNALLSDFYTRFYREAAEPMRHYHELLEQTMADQAGDVTGWPFYTIKVFDDKLVVQLHRDLYRANELAKSELVRKRIALANTSLEYTLLVRQLWKKLEMEYARGEYRQLLDAAKDDKQKRNEICLHLAEELKPFQENITRYIQSQDNLHWLKDRKNNYLKILLSPKIVEKYDSMPTLLMKTKEQK